MKKMTKMRYTEKAAALAAAVVFALTACSEREMDPVGDRVVFGAATSYDNLPETRTIYSGEEIDVSGKAVERIDWVAGTDQVFILNSSNSQSAVYTVGTPTANGTKSSAGLTHASGDQMFWASGSNTFLSVYPSGAYSATVGFHGTLPAVQAQDESHTSYAGLHGSNTSETVTNPVMSQYAYMVAREVTTRTDNVVMEYFPAVTAFEFNMAFADDGTSTPTISKFQMFSTSSALTGDWTWDGADVTVFDCPDYQEGVNDTITVNFSAPVQITAANPLRLTVFALPHDITNVTVKFFLNTGTKTLSLKDKTSGVFTTFAARKKYRISTPNVSGDWTYVIDCTDPSAVAYTGEKDADYVSGKVTSYKYSGTDTEANRVAVEWVVEGYYEDADCTVPYNGDKTAKPYWMTGYDGSEGQDEAGPGSIHTGENDEPVDITHAHSQGDTTETITNEAQTLNALIANHAQMGSQGSPYNLSNPGNNGATGHIEESANSYIVNACGYYAIPLVMGNSIKNDAPNPDETTYKGFDGDGTDDMRVLFKNYKGNNISSPWLNEQGGTPASAEIVWEDIEGLIETQKDASGANTYDLPEGCVSSDGKWLYFHVPSVREGQYIYKDADGTTRNEPRQGNAVIAVKDADGTTMWSYHIWVTDYIPKNYPGYDTSANKDVQVGVTWETDASYGRPYIQHFENTLPYKLMRRLLGFVTYGTKVTRDYPENTVYVKLRQNDGVSGLTTVMSVVQLDGQNELELYRSQPYFQSFRKDAFWPGTGLLSDDVDPEWYGKVRTVLNPDGSRNLTTNKMTIAEAINYPSTIFNHVPDALYLERVWFIGKPTNLWNSRATKPNDTNIMQMICDAGLVNWRILYFKSHNCFLLGDKTIYDPCPAGYVVPPCRIQMLTTGQGEHSDLNNYIMNAIGRENFSNDEDYQTALQTADKPVGAWIGDGWAGEDDYNVSFYTDRTHTTYFTLPKTGIRGDSGRGEYVNPLRAPLRTLSNALYDFDNDNYSPTNLITLLPGSIFSRYTSNGAPTAILPVDDSVGPDPADYPTKEQYEAGLNGGSSTPSSATSSFGRYTVMRVNPGF